MIPKGGGGKREEGNEREREREGRERGRARKTGMDRWMNRDRDREETYRWMDKEEMDRHRDRRMVRRRKYEERRPQSTGIEGVKWKSSAVETSWIL